MKTQRLLALLWLGCGISGAWIVYGFVDFYRNRDVYLTATGSAEVLRELAEKHPARRTERVRHGISEYGVLHGLNVTAVAPPSADEGPVGPPLPTEDPNRQVAEILRVLATFHDEEDPTGMRTDLAEGPHHCFVEYTDEELKKIGDPLLAVGDALPPPFQGVRVKAIFLDKVVFLLEDGQDEALLVEVEKLPVDPAILQEVTGEGGATRPASLAASAPEGWPEKTTEFEPNRRKVGVEDLRVLEEKQAEAVADFQVVPRYARGERAPSGLRVTSIRPGSPLEGKGVEAGDVVISLNGVPVTSKEQIFDYARSHPELRSFTVEIERRGRRLTLQYFLPH
jgi:hypothetical protein